MVAISKKYVTAGVAVVAVVAIAIALVYSQKKKSTYNSLASSAADGVDPFVIGGQTLDRNVWEASRRYLVSLRRNGEHNCGGTLISRRVVLTAARELNR
jgi:secreted trypsin-like serine protease